MTRRWLLIPLGLLIGLLAYELLKPERPMILSAYADNFAGQWGLSLYKDGDFQLFLPAASGTGRFQVLGDTVILHYAAARPSMPAAYLINRKGKKIDELQQVAGKWVLAPLNNWAVLQFDPPLRPLAGASLPLPFPLPPRKTTS
ncbi:hypothetical protein LJY25_14050 [Hymenobacter sp. BT175]|uniref:hypothetical protein n=1 Tax=Hymenobacter translucens TaxID=2886507 RepID=UPI001D0E4005|nr:hypothetical protein [Hymenobacter translucens]MCC2547575.1 hypothetical protein [Hymenobacter translucens]